MILLCKICYISIMTTKVKLERLDKSEITKRILRKLKETKKLKKSDFVNI